MLYTKKFVITVSLCAMLAVNPVWAVTNPVEAKAAAKSGKPGEVSTVYSDWAGRATSGIAGVSYVNSAVDAAGNAAQWAENHAAIAAQNAASAAKSASDAAGSASDAHDTLKKAVQRSSETAAVGSATLPVYVRADGTVETITSYQGKATTAGTADKAIADKNGAQIDTTYEKLSNKVTALSANSTDTQYPSAKVVYTELGKKQGTISDLTTIRSGAAAGATAVQPEDLSEVATSGSYTDLSDKPTIGSGTLTIKRNGTSVGTFNANATTAAEINITDNDTKYTLPVATSDTLGGVKQGTNITIASDGTISAKDTVYTLPAATSSTLGGVKTGTNITNNSGTISVNTTATPAANSGVPFTAGGAYTELAKKQGTISDLTTIRSGAAAGATAVQPEDLSEVATSGSYTDLSDKPTIGSGTLTIKRNGTSVGTFSANATTAAEINITDNDTKYTLPNATTSVKGGVIVGDNINVDSGKISVPAATSTTLGVVKQGTNITIASDGTISAKDTVYTLPAATSSTLGGVKTGTNITNNSGTISVATANGTTLGVVKQGTNTTISNGAVNVANATATVAGVSKLGVIPVAVDGSKTGTAEIWVE